MQKNLISAGALAAALLLALPSSAQAASAPGWRVTAKAKGIELFDVVAFSRTQAWAWGTNGDTTQVVRRVNGHWKSVPLSPYLRTGSTRALAGSSSANLWIAGTKQDPELGSVGYVARWNGSTWGSPAVLPSGLAVSALVVRGPKDVWYFTYQGIAGHFNGTKWSTVQVGFPVTRAQAAGGQIWAAGARMSTTGGTVRPSLARWTGRKWQAAKLPSGTGYLESVAIVGPKNVWAAGSTAAGRSLLLHWNGKAWKKYKAPGTGFFAISSDGAKGLWLSGSSTRLLRLTGGKWKKPAIKGVPGSSLPLVLPAFARIPGTTSVWAVGGHLSTKGFKDALVLKFGR
ncbi:MAG: hypothetical protein ABIS86_21080 [Streptosporangiaceae bacterium]